MSSGTPPTPSNPAFIFCDTDALIQTFLAKQTRLLQELKTGFSIEPVIVSEVEAELRWSRRFKTRFEHPLRKAVSTGCLALCDAGFLQRHFGAAGPSALSTIQTLGSAYGKRVGRGEAYTLAAAVTLAVPAVSNDFKALRTLEAASLELPEPVLRFFDLVVFGRQAGLLTVSDCDKIRKALAAEDEGIPSAFRRASYSTGIRSFAPRLRVAGPGTLAGSSSDNPGQGFQRPLTIARTPPSA